MKTRDLNHLATFNPSTGKADVSVAPEGLAWAATPVTKEYVEAAGLDKRFVMRHRFNTKSTLCYMVLCDESIAGWYENDQKQEEKKADRLKRCQITSEVTGKAVRCPDRKSCCGCSNADMDAETASPISYERLLEEDGFDVATYDMTSDAAMTSIAIEQIMSELSEAKGQLSTIFELRAQGLTPKEIGCVLGMKKTKLYKTLNAIGRIADKYI